MYPERLIQSSDYATLGNNSSGPIFLSVTVPNGSSAAVSSSTVVNTVASPIVFSIKNSITNEEWSCQHMQYVSPNGTTVEVKVLPALNSVVLIATPFSAIDGGTVTFTARIRTFVPPVPS